MKPFVIALTLAVTALSSSAFAQPAPGQSEPNGQVPNGQIQMRHHEPPQFAYAACSGHSEGDVVTLTTPRGKVLQATCKMSPNGLFARPHHPRMPQQQGQVGMQPSMRPSGQ